MPNYQYGIDLAAVIMYILTQVSNFVGSKLLSSAVPGIIPRQIEPHSFRERLRVSMAITPGRVVYRGLLGSPTTRRLGAIALYVALDSYFELRVEGELSQRKRFSIVLPNTPHQISSPDKLIGVLLIEPEYVDARLVERLSGLVESNSEARRRLLHGFQSFSSSDDFLGKKNSEIDEYFFGSALKPRALDCRIDTAVKQLCAQPSEHFLVASCAKLTGLSYSRFVHLFTNEVGIPFRAYVAWKRARAVLPHVSGSLSLTSLAMLTGYPDSTHFSHSIRRIYGLTPRNIVAGCRHMSVLTENEHDPPEQTTDPEHQQVSSSAAHFAQHIPAQSFG